MDFEYIKLGFQVLQFFLTGGCCIYVFMSNKDRVTNDRISKLEDDFDSKFDQQSNRVSKLEGHIANAPTHDDLAKMYDKINETSDCVSRLEG